MAAQITTTFGAEQPYDRRADHVSQVSIRHQRSRSARQRPNLLPARPEKDSHPGRGRHKGVCTTLRGTVRDVPRWADSGSTNNIKVEIPMFLRKETSEHYLKYSFAHFALLKNVGPLPAQNTLTHFGCPPCSTTKASSIRQPDRNPGSPGPISSHKPRTMRRLLVGLKMSKNFRDKAIAAIGTLGKTTLLTAKSSFAP